MNNQIECKCGGHYLIQNKSRHLKSEKHKTFEYIKYCIEEYEQSLLKEIEEKEKIYIFSTSIFS